MARRMVLAAGHRRDAEGLPLADVSARRALNLAVSRQRRGRVESWVRF
jgi:hypothetical protein